MTDTKRPSRVWERFIDELKDEAGILAKQELKDLIASAKQDSASFIKKQGVKLEGRLTELAEKKISAAQFEGYVKNIKDLIEMKARWQGGDAASARCPTDPVDRRLNAYLARPQNRTRPRRGRERSAV